MINLMPSDVKEAVKFAARNVSMIQYSILVLVIGLTMGGVITFGIQVVRSDEANLKKAIALKETQLLEYSATNSEAKVLSDKIKTIKTLLEREVKFSEIIQEIGGLIPPGARLDTLHLTEDFTENLSLTVTVPSKQVATELQQNLINSETFLGADIQSLSANADSETGSVQSYSVVLIAAFTEADSGAANNSPSSAELFEQLENSEESDR